MKPEEVRAIRKEMGLSQTEFSKRIGVSMRAIQTYEQGKSSPSSNALLKLIELKAKYLPEGEFTNNERSYLSDLGDKYSKFDMEEIVFYLTQNHDKLIQNPIYKSFVKNMALELALDIVSKRFIKPTE